jgi:uncharacterized membrane protein
MSHTRNVNIDIIRSLAIVIMIIANSAILLKPEYHYSLFRLFCSLAAPLFITLSGVSFQLSFDNTQYKDLFARNKIRSALYLLCTASMIDMFIWHVLPFQNFDVLYIISIGIIVNTILLNQRIVFKFMAAIVIIMLALFLQSVALYRFSVTYIPIDSISANQIFLYVNNGAQALFLDGWFPFFPWIAFSVIGTLLNGYMNGINKSVVIGIASTTFIFSSYSILTFLPLQTERSDYLELFYPANISILIVLFSFITLIFSLFGKHIIKNTFIDYLSIIGRHSLFVYIFHTIIISYIFSSYPHIFTMQEFLLFMLVLIISCYICTFCLELQITHNILKKCPVIMRRILGL